MQKDLSDVEFLIPDSRINLDAIKGLRSLPPFADELIDYFDALSKELAADTRTRRLSDVATFGFYCRRANLLHLRKRHGMPGAIRLGRGVVFHVAPSNVPVNFAYSLLAGLLSGNANIVRVPTKPYEQVNVIVEAMRRVGRAEAQSSIRNRAVLVRYDRASAATRIFSSMCDVRVIWGGDDTIARIRKSPLPARSFDITFADRYSLCAINADRFVTDADPKKLAAGFYNDTYLSDQNACTSPHLVIWVGSDVNVGKAQSLFWDNLHDLARERYKIQSVVAVDKLTEFYRQASRTQGVFLACAQDNLLWRVALNEIPNDIDQYRCRGGYFAEYHAPDLAVLSAIAGRKFQTLAYYGFSNEEMSALMLELTPAGIDRIVPFGSTMDFSLTWDGYDLIASLSRHIEIM